MDRRWVFFVAAAGLALAVALGVALAPDTGPDPVPVPVPVPAARRPPSDRAAPSPTAPGRPLPVPPGIGPPPRRGVAPDAVHPADSRGLASATVERRGPLVACWQAFLDRGGPGDGPTGRFTVQVTLAEGTRQVETSVPNAPDDPDLADCVQAALADARFEAPPEGSVSLLVPIPLAPAPQDELTEEGAPR